MRIIAILLILLGAGFLVYSFTMIGNVNTADVGPLEIDDNPRGKWEPITGLFLLLGGILAYYFYRKKRA